MECCDRFLLRYSTEDGCWLAHSLATDQMSDGKTPAEALSNLQRGLEFFHQACDGDPTIRRWRTDGEAAALLRDLLDQPAT